MDPVAQLCLECQVVEHPVDAGLAIVFSLSGELPNLEEVALEEKLKNIKLDLVDLDNGS